VFLKLFQRIYAPLAARILSPIKGDARLYLPKQSRFDRHYQHVVDDLNQLVRAVGVKKPLDLLPNANKIHVSAGITAYAFSTETAWPLVMVDRQWRRRRQNGESSLAYCKTICRSL